jgi:predicted Rossmann-fold nucleotide-binding protein
VKVIVCGGRSFRDYPRLAKALNNRGITEIIEGGASGADQCANRWAYWNLIRCTRVRADWGTYGRAAGPLRNAEMLKLKPDLVIAFPGGSGTANMVAQARAAGIEVEHA